MKITYKKGDVTAASEKVFMHGCNCQGVMGSGVARIVREKFPEAFAQYSALCSSYKDEDKKTALLGDIQFVRCGDVRVLNAFTQFGFGGGRQINYEAIFCAFHLLDSLAPRFGFKAVAMPRIGAGLGGGNWRIIEAMIEETSTNYQPVVYDL